MIKKSSVAWLKPFWLKSHSGSRVCLMLASSALLLAACPCNVVPLDVVGACSSLRWWPRQFDVLLMPLAIQAECEDTAVAAVLLASLLAPVPPAQSASSCRCTSSAWRPVSRPCIHAYYVLVRFSVSAVPCSVLAVALAIVYSLGLMRVVQVARWLHAQVLLRVSS